MGFDVLRDKMSDNEHIKLDNIEILVNVSLCDMSFLR